MSESNGFRLLHRNIQRWIWNQNWSKLRDIQEQAIEPILKADCDVIISAPTAAGKTEAAFLPACSRIVENDIKGVGILYISPLKALINDQFRRLESLAEISNILLTPWHGDVPDSVKNKQQENPNGIILITPESLESLLFRRHDWCIKAFSSLSHIIIDEFHAFLGSERGCQLQSLMHRIDFLLGRIVPRIALSATLSDMEQVAHFLRPSPGDFPSKIIESSTTHSTLRIQLRGYLNSYKKGLILKSKNCKHLFKNLVDDFYGILRGKSHLIFANSREFTEGIATGLSDLCVQNGVPNEFFPHYGNLSKDIREDIEKRLQKGNLPTTAVCTSTLELGIDIGKVDSIAQVSYPPSVACLRQRLGRSGRRDNSPTLRLFVIENIIEEDTELINNLRLEAVQCIAMTNLMLQKWCEPPPSNQYHLSTLVQQTLSVIGQYGGVRADQLWSLLCKTGPFYLVDQKLYVIFLKALGEHNLITQMHDGLLVLGAEGEKLTGHYSFYAAFNSPEEYILESEGGLLGRIPITIPLSIGEIIIFNGKRWEVQNVDPDRRIITLKKAMGGQPLRIMDPSGIYIHDVVRQEMWRIYRERSIPRYLDETAIELVSEGIDNFYSLGLDKTCLL